jgi:uncharacterized membrane protein
LSKKKKTRKASPKKQATAEKTINQEHSTERKKKQPPAQKLILPNWALTGLAAVGMILTAYLAVSGWMSEAPLLCSDGSSCDLVQQSRWGSFLNLPTAFWGFLTYSILFYIGVRVPKPGTHWKSAWTVSMLGLGYSIYLMAISLFVIQAVCLYCIASFTIMTLIFGVVTFQRSHKISKSRFPAFARQTVFITAIIVGGMHLHYSGVFDPAAGPEDPYLKGLAEHLTQEKAVLYGAYW